MKKRGFAALCALAFLFCSSAKADPQATLPPGLPATVAAPQVVLPVWLYSVGDRMVAPEQVAASDTDIVVSGRIEVVDVSSKRVGKDVRNDASNGSDSDESAYALWHIDPVTGIASLLYEARTAVEICTPVLCKGQLYWVEVRKDQRAQWRILTWNRQRGKAELVRENPNRRGDILPQLATDGERVYWYESYLSAPKEAFILDWDMAIFALKPDIESPEVSFIGAVRSDDAMLYVLDGRITYSSPHDEDGSWIVQFDVNGDYGQDDHGDLQLEAVPYNAQSTRAGQIFWQQADTDGINVDPKEQEIGEQAQSEEEPILQTETQSMSTEGQLWMCDLGHNGPLTNLHAQAETLLVCPEGAYFVSDAHALYFYSLALGRVLKLTAFADYMPALCAQGNALYVLRAIDDGEAMHYRVAKIDVTALQSSDWPPLQ